MPMDRFAGVMVPVLTPFKADLTPDADKFVKLCKWMLANGATALAPFGTTSESNSMSVAERMALLEALVKGGVDPLKIMPGAGCCSLSDNVQLVNHAAEMGCGAVLMLPPFYYKNANDDGFFWMFEETIKRMTKKDMHVYVYHIPPQTVKGFSLDPAQAVGGGVPREHRRHQGQQRRLGQHQIGDRLHSGLHRVPRFRAVPAAGPARRCGGLHHGVGQRQSDRHPQGLRQLADAGSRRLAGPYYRECARSFSPIR